MTDFEASTALSEGAADAPRRIGDRTLHPIGFGSMPLSAQGRPDRAQAVRTIHAALDAGVRLLDTADAYALDENDIGHGERLLGEVLRGRGDDVIVATKGGHVRRGTAWDLDGSPAHLRAACEASLRNLGTEAIGLYQFHRPDPRVPFAESVGALRDLRDEGKIVHAGLSNVTVSQLEEAEQIVPIAAVQNELSLTYAAPFDNGEVDACAARGIPLLAWAPLGGKAKAHLAPGQVAPVRAAADTHGVSPQRVVLAWLLACSPAVMPIPGASRPETIRDSAAAAGLRLEKHERLAISRFADRTPRAD
jgi:aryl-alcohol dehydrogenase-like predicted oxidoreductase